MFNPMDSIGNDQNLMESMDKNAKLYRQQYESFISKGFSKEQATYLTAEHMKTVFTIMMSTGRKR